MRRHRQYGFGAWFGGDVPEASACQPKSFQKYNRSLMTHLTQVIFLSEDKISITGNITPELTKNLSAMGKVEANFARSRDNAFVTYQVLKISVLAPLKLFSQNEVQ